MELIVCSPSCCSFRKVSNILSSDSYPLKIHVLLQPSVRNTMCPSRSWMDPDIREQHPPHPRFWPFSPGTVQVCHRDPPLSASSCCHMAVLGRCQDPGAPSLTELYGPVLLPEVSRQVKGVKNLPEHRSTPPLNGPPLGASPGTLHFLAW